MDGFSLIILPKCHKKVFQKLSCHLLTNIEKTEVPKDWLKCDSLKGNTMTLYHVHLFQTVTISGKFNIFNYFAYYLFCDIKANNVSLPFEASHEDTQDVQLKIMNKNLEFPTAQYGSSGQYILLIISLKKQITSLLFCTHQKIQTFPITLIVSQISAFLLYVQQKFIF